MSQTPEALPEVPSFSLSRGDSLRLFGPSAEDAFDVDLGTLSVSEDGMVTFLQGQTRLLYVGLSVKGVKAETFLLGRAFERGKLPQDQRQRIFIAPAESPIPQDYIRIFIGETVEVSSPDTQKVGFVGELTKVSAESEVREKVGLFGLMLRRFVPPPDPQKEFFRHFKALSHPENFEMDQSSRRAEAYRSWLVQWAREGGLEWHSPPPPWESGFRGYFRDGKGTHLHNAFYRWAVAYHTWRKEGSQGPEPHAEEFDLPEDLSRYYDPVEPSAQSAAEFLDGLTVYRRSLIDWGRGRSPEPVPAPTAAGFGFGHGYAFAATHGLETLLPELEAGLRQVDLLYEWASEVNAWRDQGSSGHQPKLADFGLGEGPMV